MADLDEQALAWAQSNPDDPRAADVMAKAWAAKNPSDPRAKDVQNLAEGNSTDVGRLKMSFADPETRAKLRKIAFTEHPINWMESHAGDVLPMLGMTGGAVGGGALGAMAGAPGGPLAIGSGYAGGVAGAGAGAGAGEAARVALGRYLGVNKGSMADQALGEAKSGALAEAVGAPVMAGVGKVGKYAYENTLRPVIEQAMREGKTAVADTLYKYGVMTANNLPQKSKAIISKIEREEVQPILQRAEQAGAKLDPETTLGPMKNFEETEAGIRTPESEMARNAAQKRLDYYQEQMAGKPAEPGKITMSESPILDETGKPYQHFDMTEGTPAVPPKPYGVLEGGKVKSRVGFDRAKNTSTPLEQRLDNAIYEGFMKGQEEAVGETLGQGEATKLHDANAKIGGLIQTESGQATAANQYDRLKGNMLSLRGTDAFAGGIGAAASGGTLSGFLEGYLAKKGIDAMRVGQMPAGYLARKLADNPVLRNAVISANSPWAKMVLEKQKEEK